MGTLIGLIIVMLDPHLSVAVRAYDISRHADATDTFTLFTSPTALLLTVTSTYYFQA